MKKKLPSNLILLILTLAFTLSSCEKSALPPPVKVSYRKSMVGAGMVLQIQNDSSHHLYNVKVIGRNFEEVSSASVIASKHLPPGGITEVGWLEFVGWTPRSGETMEIYADDYITPHISIIP